MANSASAQPANPTTGLPTPVFFRGTSLANNTNAQVTVDRLIDLFEQRQLMDINGRGKDAVDEWKRAEEGVYHPVSGLLRTFKRPSDRPHLKFKNEMHCLLKALHENAKKKTRT